MSEYNEIKNRKDATEERQTNDEIKQLRARVAELEEALAWYADPENYLTGFDKPGQIVWNVMYEGGERARNALKGGE